MLFFSKKGNTWMTIIRWNSRRITEMMLSPYQNLGSAAILELEARLHNAVFLVKKFRATQRPWVPICLIPGFSANDCQCCNTLLDMFVYLVPDQYQENRSPYWYCNTSGVILMADVNHCVSFNSSSNAWCISSFSAWPMLRGVFLNLYILSFI